MREEIKKFHEGIVVHKGRIYRCECGAELKRVPDNKRSVRRRCKNCRKRWKLIIHENVKIDHRVLELAAERILIDHHDKLESLMPYKGNIRIRSKAFDEEDW